MLKVTLLFLCLLVQILCNDAKNNANYEHEDNEDLNTMLSLNGFIKIFNEKFKFSTEI